MKQLKTYKKSVTVQGLAGMLVVSIGLLVGFELMCIFFLAIYEKQTVKNYEDSLTMQYEYWDDTLEVINNSMVQLTSTDYADASYWYVCNTAPDSLQFQAGKVILQRRISEISSNHGDLFQLFIYVPESNVFIKSSQKIVSYEERRELDHDICSYINGMKSSNSPQWTLFQNNEDFLIQVYQLSDGYIGAVTKCSNLLSDNPEVVSEIRLIDGEVMGEKKYTLIPMDNLSYKIGIELNRERILHLRTYFIWIPIITIVFGMLLLMWSARYQMKYILRPLMRLRYAMEQYSGGNMDIRLEENDAKEEIQTLYHTFNSMAEKINHQKIEIYEVKLEQERIQSNYLKVQIRPHFYTNVLNLIYGLAQIREYQAIQRLALVTGTYFRYLLGAKGTFVPLEEELRCIRNYMEIQQIRYEGMITFEMKAEEDIMHQMILPIILQTFVENCVKHNVTLVPVLKIRVVVQQKRNMLCMSVSDNGVGFSSDVLKKLNEGENISEHGEHIGIHNVQERLRIFYGTAAEMKMISEPGNTVIYINLPVLPQNKEDI